MIKGMQTPNSASLKVINYERLLSYNLHSTKILKYIEIEDIIYE